MKKKTIVAVSGGIDSLYTAYKLIEAGHAVEGLHFLTGFAPVSGRSAPPETTPNIIRHCECPEVTAGAMELVAQQLGIKIHIVDISSEFKHHVTDYFIRAYRNGQTPNPCLACNPAIKFGVVKSFANSLGADIFATGHYAQTARDEDGRFHLYKGLDSKKDQSYFLAFLTQNQLEGVTFPLGGETKTEITEKAFAAGLEPVSAGESQDICFIEGSDYKEFLKEQSGYHTEPGDMVTESGEIVGAHKGLDSYTIGQRRGLNCPGPYPYYVLRLDTEANRLIIGPKSSLLSSRCAVTGIHWLNPVESTEINVTARVRYGHKGEKAIVRMTSPSEAEIVFEEPVSAITPGQGAVFYNDQEVLGGGWIK